MSARIAFSRPGRVKPCASFGAVFALCVGFLLFPACNSTATSRKTNAHLSAGRPHALVSALHDSLRARNARITTLEVLDIEPIPWSTSHLALIVRGAAQAEFNGQFEDELFGVFLIDSTLTQVERTVDMLPTRRWHDYAVKFERAGLDSLIVVGAGVAHGDQVIRHVYDWNAELR